MALDTDRIDEAVLALLYLGLHGECRAWKGFDWDAMDRLYKKGLIQNPVRPAPLAGAIRANVQEEVGGRQRVGWVERSETHHAVRRPYACRSG
jgi:hypothetical protein